MTGEEIAKFLTEKLIKLEFVIHRYDVVTTSSIYLKLDYGICCGICIADHYGRKRSHYRFNIVKDYKGNRAIKRDGLICRFYDFSELEDVIDSVQIERQKKSINMEYKTIKCIWRKSDLYNRFRLIKKGLKNIRKV